MSFRKGSKIIFKRIYKNDPDNKKYIAVGKINNYLEEDKDFILVLILKSIRDYNDPYEINREYVIERTDIICKYSKENLQKIILDEF